MRRDPHPPVGQVLVVDAGGSLTKLALASGEDLSRLGSFATVGDGIAGWPARLAAAVGRSAGAIGHVALSSVPPDLPALLGSRCAPPGRDPVPVRVVGPGSVDLPVAYGSPSGLGADRLANAVAASHAGGRRWSWSTSGRPSPATWSAPGPGSPAGRSRRVPRRLRRARRRRAVLAQPGGLAVDGELPLVGHDGRGRAGRRPARCGRARRRARPRLPRGHGAVPGRGHGRPGAVVARECDTVTAVDPDLTLRGILLATRGGARPAGERLTGPA